MKYLLAFQQAIVLMFSGAKGWVFDNPDIQEPWLLGDELTLYYTCEPCVSTHKDSTSLIIAVYAMEITFLEYKFCSDLFMLYNISQEICTWFLLCCALLWLYIDWFSHIHQVYFTGTVAI